MNGGYIVTTLTQEKSSHYHFCNKHLFTVFKYYANISCLKGI